jgi:hypothetical protein
MRRLVSAALILTVAALLGPMTHILAQAQTGTLAGKVTVEGGAPLPANTAVNIMDGDKIVRSVPIGADGTFSVAGLPPGNYSVQLVSARGSDRVAIFGATSTVTVAAGATTTVEVTAQREAVRLARMGLPTRSIVSQRQVLVGGLLLATAAIAIVAANNNSSPSR